MRFNGFVFLKKKRDSKVFHFKIKSNDVLIIEVLCIFKTVLTAGNYKLPPNDNLAYGLVEL